MIRLPLLGLIVIALALAPPFTTATSPQQLLVCVDPNNLALPNQAAQSWQNQRRDLRPGLATGMDILAARRPDYRSSNAFVARADQPLTGLTLDDRGPRSLTIGLQMVGRDAMNSPPAFATARRGLARSVQGYMHSGNYDWSNPPAGTVNALVTAGSMLRWNGNL
jgi:mxaJ protein